MPWLGAIERREQLDLRSPPPSRGCLAGNTAVLPKPLLQISGEVFKPAQGSCLDLHMLAKFFHDRQIEQNLVDCVRTIP